MRATFRKEHHTLSDINVTPFVDIVLVLLIIFMISAPMIRGSFDVNLPDAVSATEVSTENAVTITLYSDGTVKVNGQFVRKELLVKRVKDNLKSPSEPVLIEADERTPYKYVAEILDRLREGGVKKIGLLTEPLR